MRDSQFPGLRKVIWLGDTRKVLRSFPVEVQKMTGFELRILQAGLMPKNVKPFREVGSGILEIALRYRTNAYRAVVAVQLGEDLYVLHVFQKKSTKGISTPQRDIDLIKQRYKEAKEIAHDHEA
ncbi:MAG: type II toxin-antitoxin system RelE/ParE family toxin [Syntrophobacteraceae bacterium]|nr:type II toxin-antitoxin system RelE/ParE family toxin [Desulfobacteraceae bacterium]